MSNDPNTGKPQNHLQERISKLVSSNAEAKNGSDVIQDVADKVKRPVTTVKNGGTLHLFRFHYGARNAGQVFMISQGAPSSPLESERPEKPLKNQFITSLGNIKILYTGEELRQRDYDVYLEILNVARGVTITSENPWIHIDAWAMLRALKWQVNSVGLTELHETITRLIACKVEITRQPDSKSAPSTFYGGAFIHEHAGQFAQDPSETARWMVVINTTIAQQLQPGQYMQIDKKVRQALSSSALGKWLHLFYSSHQQPYPMQIETIKSLAGLEEDETKVFKFNLRAQMDRLVEMNVIFAYNIDDKNKLHVLKNKK